MGGVLGIDSSLTGLALAWWSPTLGEGARELTSEAAGPLLEDRFRRYATLVSEVRETAATVDPTLVLLEGYSYASTGSVIVLAELGSQLRSMFLASPWPLVEVAPAEVKKHATGKGNATKPLVVSSIASRLRRVFASDNLADATAILLLGLGVLELSPPGLPTSANQTQREIEAQVRNKLPLPKTAKRRRLK